MKGIGKRGLTWLCVIFLVLDGAIAAVLVKTILQDRESRTSGRELLAQPIGQQALSGEAHEAWRMDTLGDVYQWVTLYSEPVAVRGQMNLMFSNAAQNPYAVRMEMQQLDTGLLIARTDLVDPGWRVEKVPLLTDMAPGRYQCLAELHFYDPQTNGLLGTTARMVLLTVK